MRRRTARYRRRLGLARRGGARLRPDGARRVRGQRPVTFARTVNDGGGRPNVSPERSSRRYDSIGRYVLSRNRLPKHRSDLAGQPTDSGSALDARAGRPSDGSERGTITPGSSRGARRRGRVSSWRSSRGRSGADPRPSVYAGRIAQADQPAPCGVQRPVRELCGAVRDTGSPYCSTSRPARVAWLHRLREARRRARNCRKKPTEPR